MGYKETEKTHPTRYSKWLSYDWETYGTDLRNVNVPYDMP